jgi:hypothetical protein
MAGSTAATASQTPSNVHDGSGNVTTMNSGNTYRFRADGSRFEQVTWGQVNPFGMTFDPWGNAYDSVLPFHADLHAAARHVIIPASASPTMGLGYAPNDDQP